MLIPCLLNDDEVDPCLEGVAEYVDGVADKLYAEGKIHGTIFLIH